MKSNIINLLTDQKTRNFFLAGLVNTIFSYLVGIFLYGNFHTTLHILIILIVLNVISITFSFSIYKIFVFKTKGRWVQEYFRCYLIYGVASIFSILFMYVTVDFFKIPFWISQGVVIIPIMLLSYFGHDRFTFKMITTP